LINDSKGSVIGSTSSPSDWASAGYAGNGSVSNISDNSYNALISEWGLPTDGSSPNRDIIDSLLGVGVFNSIEKVSIGHGTSLLDYNQGTGRYAIYSPSGLVDSISNDVVLGYQMGTSDILGALSSIGKGKRPIEPLPMVIKDVYLYIGNPSNDSALVRLLQQRLNALGIRDEYGRMLDEDGIFGKNTMYAVNAYKDIYLPGGNTGDMRGIVGNTTWDHMEIGRLIERSNDANMTLSGHDSFTNIPDGTFFWPTTSKTITDPYGTPRSNGERTHDGIDIAGPIGNPVYAATSGTVTIIKWDSDDEKARTTINGVPYQGVDGGYYIEIISSDELTKTRYFHLQADSAMVSKGNSVKAGQQIATLGNTGNGQPHLHFRVHVYDNGWNSVDPSSLNYVYR